MVESGLLPGVIRRLSRIASSVRRSVALPSSPNWASEALSEIPDGVVVTDPEGRVVLMNARAEGLTGTRESHAVGRLVEDVLHLHLEAGFTPQSPLRRALRLGGAVDAGHLVTLFDPTGAVRELAATGVPIHGPEGEILGAMLLLRDGAPRRQTEEAVRRAAEFEQFFARAPLGMHRLAPDGTILSANAAEIEILGWSPEHYIGHNIAEFLEDPMEARLLLGRIQTGQRVRDAAVRMRSSDGRLRAVILDETGVWLDGSLSAIQGMLRDDSQRRRSEAELAWAQERADAADKARDRFLAVLGHELRTPLTPVLLAVGELEASTHLTAGARTHLAVIRRNIELEARLIDDLLEMTRIHRGDLEMQTREVEVHALLANVNEFSRGDVEAKHLDVEMKLEATRHAVIADPARLQQVFWNLLHNAVKFTPPGGRITIRTGNPPSRLRIEFTDTGVGITENDLGRIFDAFTHGQEGRPFGGLGVGLSIARTFVEAHGGRLTAASGGKGQGATFTVDLPGPIPATHRRPNLRPATHSVRILLVEDHEDTAQMLAQILEGMNYAVRTASSLAGGLAAAREESFDLLISDIGLPDGTGFELMKTIRADMARAAGTGLRGRAGVPARSLAEAPVRSLSETPSQAIADAPMRGIALSGYGLEGDADESRSAGFDVHLIKPVAIERLLREIHRLTDA